MDNAFIFFRANYIFVPDVSLFTVNDCFEIQNYTVQRIGCDIICLKYNRNDHCTQYDQMDIILFPFANQSFAASITSGRITLYTLRNYILVSSDGREQT